jgi:hypothetical protein
MHDYIHAAIATERVRDYVEMGDKQRTNRRLRPARPAQAAAPASPQPLTASAIGRVATALRLRPRLR